MELRQLCQMEVSQDRRQKMKLSTKVADRRATSTSVVSAALSFWTSPTSLRTSVSEESEDLYRRLAEDEDEGEMIDKRTEEDIKREDFANNNQSTLKADKSGEEGADSREGSVEKSDESDGDDKDPLQNIQNSLNALINVNSNLPQLFSFPGNANTTLEALQNTKMAIAQFASTTMANNVNNPAALHELAVLQSSLYALQQQHLMQLQLIQQLQQQLQITRSKESSPALSVGPESVEPSTSLPQSSTPVSTTSTTSTLMATSTTTLASRSMTSLSSQPICSSAGNMPILHPSPPPMSSSIAATVITNNDPTPPPDEPNSLEMLQRTAQQVLNNASQGLLSSSLMDDLAFRKGKPPNVMGGTYDSRKDEPFYKHRCRFCGKVFGSDSALQIHIRSHTGERPFKCNVCGSRFTTKGNLKVHFQRHTTKFPHIPMNGNPIPEHLDKFHPPPILQQLESPPNPPRMPGLPPTSNPPLPQNPFPSPTFGSSFPLFRPPHDLLNRPLNLLSQKKEQDLPENLSNKRSSREDVDDADAVKKELPESDGSGEAKMEEDKRSYTPIEADREVISENSIDKSLKEAQEDQEMEEEPEINCQNSNDGCESQDMKPETVEGIESVREEESNQDDVDKVDVTDNDGLNMSVDGDDTMDKPLEDDSDQPQNLSKSASLPNSPTPSSGGGSGSFHGYSPRQRLFPPPIPPFGGSLPLMPPTSPSFPPPIDPSKHPAIYTSLLPKPGSTDNSWEALIEVQKTSETSKLQQLVDNIENKLTDPNQCVICHRVLSCKSALQMHYRTHTGERPYKCKICSRAFTTKGNLKTHMGVHRAKPPMRVLHQCPVCHKKYTNALVLQQHIRFHTGEPTDLSPEQIDAAEVKDYPPYPIPTSLPPVLPGNFPPLLPPYSPGTVAQNLVKKDDERSDSEKHKDDSSLPATPSPLPTYSASMIALENQVATTLASMEANMKHVNGNKSPVRTPPLAPPLDVESFPDAQEPGKSPEDSTGMPPVSGSASPASVSGSESGSVGALDLTPRTSVSSVPAPPVMPPNSMLMRLGIVPPVTSSSLMPFSNSVLPPSPFNPLGFPLPQSAMLAQQRGYTTCNICYKMFACQSALEIHYRSHTKERPYKCDFCDRGFSTKGNLRQHLLTHKLQDSERKEGDENNSPPSNNRISVKPEAALKRSPPDGDSTLPLPKRPPGLPKHYCHVCKKNFSSASALQIHMRTHTGDRPFKCTVCGRAFTTKGNLKVHMGTHMWNNCSTRRGRRMSLELPPMSLPPTLSPSHHQQVKDLDFLQRRPDLFFPYLPAPFLNGMQQPKDNGISVIHNLSNNSEEKPNHESGKQEQSRQRLSPNEPPPVVDGVTSPRSPSPTSPAPPPPLSRDLPWMWKMQYKAESGEEQEEGGEEQEEIPVPATAHQQQASCANTAA